MHRDSQFPVLSDSDHSHGHVTVSRSSPPVANLNLPVNGTHAVARALSQFKFGTPRDDRLRPGAGDSCFAWPARRS